MIITRLSRLFLDASARELKPRFDLYLGRFSSLKGYENVIAEHASSHFIEVPPKYLFSSQQPDRDCRHV